MSMKKILLVSTLIVVIIGGGVGSYLLGRHQRNNTTQNLPTQTTTTTPTTPAKSTPTPAKKVTVDTLTPAGLLQASYTRKLTDFSPWQDSQVKAVYRDFNGDGVQDVFVWAKIPGTMGYSFAAVWTIDSNNKPQELWYLQSDLYVAQSDWTVTSNDGLQNNGKKENSDGTISDVSNTFHWQASTTGQGFVLEPNI